MPPVPLGTSVDLTLEQFAESFKGFRFAIQFCYAGGVQSRICQVTGEVNEKGLEVVVVE